MTEREVEIKENYLGIVKNIERVKRDCGIERNITLLAATKTVPPKLINFAADELGICDIGENRVNELLEKYGSLHREKMNIHFIGTLQTNKVKYIIDKVCLIHSLDSLKLAAEIDRRAREAGKVMDVLVEINIGREPNKGGVMPEEAENFVSAVSVYPNVRTVGIMTIAPVCDNKEDIKKYFDKTYQIFIDISQKKLHNIREPVLSMGMSGSYETAIECGSGMIRLGTALFGKRK